PDVSHMSDLELWGSMKAEVPRFRKLFAEHLVITTGATVPVGLINQVCAELGDPGVAMKLVSGIGGVDSAAPSWPMWHMGRIVAASPALTSAFDRGGRGLMD